jgi:NADH dehydrogenase I subunit E
MEHAQAINRYTESEVTMFCPKCSKFVPSSANACPNCGIPIITGFSPNYGAGFDLGDDDSESRNDAPPRKVMDSDLYDDIPDMDEKPPADSGIGSKLKSLFGFGKG